MGKSAESDLEIYFEIFVYHEISQIKTMQKMLPFIQRRNQFTLAGQLHVSKERVEQHALSGNGSMVQWLKVRFLE